MDYRFTPEEEAFRSEIQTFLKAEVPADWDFDPFELREDTWDFAHSFTRKLAGKGWIAPAWPAEYGGQDLPFMKQVVLSEELAYFRAEHGHHRHQLRRPDAHGLRHRGAEERADP